MCAAQVCHPGVQPSYAAQVCHSGVRPRCSLCAQVDGASSPRCSMQGQLKHADKAPELGSQGTCPCGLIGMLIGALKVHQLVIKTLGVPPITTTNSE